MVTLGFKRGSIATAVVMAVAVAGSGTALAAPPNRTPTPVIATYPATYTNTTSATFTFTDSNAGAVFTCSLDGARSTCTSPKTYSGLAVTAHSFKLTATAPGLKASSAVTKSWTIDVTAPNAPTVSQPASPTKNTTTSVTFSSTSTDVLSYRCSVDGAVETACTSPKSVTVAEGFHTLAVKAVDRAGNTSTAKTVAWVVDTSTPPPVISSGPPTVSGSSSASFTFSSTEPGVTLTCSLDSTTTYTACSSPKTYPGLSNGNHTVRVRGTDAAGNVATSDPFTWKVQVAPPIVLAWSNPAGLPNPVTSGVVGAFAFTATGQTTLACRLDGVDQATCTSPESASGLSDGAHTYALVANSGLASEVQLKYTWTVDTVAPGAPSVAGPSGTVASTSADITVGPAAVGDAVACTLDTVTIGCSAPLSLTGLAEGPHTLVAVASDAAGNTASTSLDWAVDITAPVPSFTDPPTLAGAAKVEFDEAASGVSASSLFLADDLGSVVASTMKCYTSGAAVTSCANTDVARVDLTPVTAMLAGGYYTVTVNPVVTPTVTDLVGNVSTLTTHNFRAATSVDELSSALTNSWRKVADRKAKGGSYFVEHRKGAKASWAFSGRSVSLVTVIGPTFGKANILIDGVRKATVNNYAAGVRYGVLRTVKNLKSGKHTVTVQALGKKGNKKGKGTLVAIDAFKVGKKVTTTPTLTSVGWQHTTNAAASGGSYAVADLKTQSTTLRFRGTGVTLLTARGKGYGKGAIYVDGTLAATFDNYAATSSWQVAQAVSGLTDATHTVVVKVLGTKNSKATSSAVVVDGFTIL